MEGYLLEGAKLLPRRGTLTAPACIFLTYVGLHLILHMQEEKKKKHLYRQGRFKAGMAPTGVCCISTITVM